MIMIRKIKSEELQDESGHNAGCSRLKLAKNLPLVIACNWVAIVLLAVASGQQFLLGQNVGLGKAELTEPGKAFKDFQADAPPIEYIVFEQSYDRGVDNLPGVVWADGAIQPGGYYLRHLTNSPYTKNLLVKGASTESEWEYLAETETISYGPRTHWTNYESSMNLPLYRSLQMVARLGLPRIFTDHDSFTWTSQTEFRFNTPFDHFAGSIVKFDQRNRPTELEYHSLGKKHGLKTEIYYEYNSDSNFPPDKWVIHYSSPSSDSTSTNILHKFFIGLNGHSEHGYYLMEFLAEAAKVGSIYVISNNVRYTLQPDGSMAEYKYLYSGGNSSHSVHYPIIFVFLARTSLTEVLLMRQRGALK